MVQTPELVAEYTSLLPPQRRERIIALHQFICDRFPTSKLSLKYKMPTYTLADGWVSIASQKNYVSLYTCAREHIDPYVNLHPDVKCGTGCLNFRDGDEIFFSDLQPVLESAFYK